MSIIPRSAVGALVTAFVAASCAQGEPVDTGSGGGSGSGGGGDSGAAGAAGADASDEGDAFGGSSGWPGTGGAGATGGSSGSGGSSGGGGTTDAPAEAPLDSPADVAPDAPLFDTGPDAPTGPVDTCPGETIPLTGSNPLTGLVTGGTPPGRDMTGSCGGAVGRDAVHLFHAPTSGSAHVLFSPQYNGVLYVRTNCLDTASEVGCVDAAGTFGDETLDFFAQANSDYYIIADGKTATDAGLYGLQVTLTPSPPQESCPGTAVPWTGTSPRTATVSGNTSSLFPDTTGTCASAGGDAVYSFTADTDGIMDVTLNPTAYNGVLYLRTSSCTDTGMETACLDTAGSGAAEHQQFWAQNGLTYYAFVDGTTAADVGAYSLTATLMPATADEKCPGVAQTGWTGTGNQDRVLTFTGDTSARWPDLNAACGTAGGGTGAARDVVYSFTAPVAGALTINLVTSGWDGVLYLADQCGNPPLQCANANSNGNETITLLAPAGTSYSLVVDGASAGASGTFTVTATQVPEQANDRCPGELLTPNTATPPVAQVTADISKLSADYLGNTTAANCAQYANGLDAVYSVMAPKTGTMTVLLTPSNFAGVVYVRQTCDGTSQTLGCGYGNGSGSPEFTTIPVSTGTTYWIFVDSDSSPPLPTPSNFTLKATFN